jgi:hypothetical protein
MLGLAVPATVADVDPHYLGLAGLYTFSDRFQELATEQERDDDSPHKTTFVNLARQIAAIGHSRYWFHKLIQTCQPPLLEADLADDLQTQFADVIQSWKAISMRLGMGAHGQRIDMIHHVARRLERVHEQESELFHTLLGALPDYEWGVL